MAGSNHVESKKKWLENQPKGIHGKIHRLNRSSKRAIMMVTDVFLLAVAVYVSFFLRLGYISESYFFDLLPLFTIIPIGGVLTGWLLGFYNTLIRAFEFRTLNTLLAMILISGLFIAAYGYLVTDVLVPRSVPAIFFLVAFPLVGSSRVLARWYYGFSLGLNSKKQNVLIYGAGETGSQVAGILSGSPEFALVGFIDDDKALQGHYMRGRKVYAPSDLDRVVRRFGDVKVLLSITNINSAQKRSILQRLREYDIDINIVPSLADVVAGRAPINEIRALRIEDVLGRQTIPPIKELFDAAISGKTIVVSGAGGSIGSEICRQIVANKPEALIVFDSSELALYKLEQELNSLMEVQASQVPVSYHLGNVCERGFVKWLLHEYRPNIVYHAAAYKHVPIVEDNILEGIRNNVIGTHIMATESAACGVERFILVSTDKAVRPTNVMGATKRLAELVTQAISQSKTQTIFSMVRFGNVLGSSGSVIPLFRSQIEKGGPVTVTHREVTRYFMTIPEAAQLVIQAGFLARGGEVFVLDMGEPVNIAELAELVINLSGYSVRNEKSPDGDIEITYTGLRPGEKLYEELLIGDNSEGTQHPKIMQAREKSISHVQMAKHIKTLSASIEKRQPEIAVDLMEKLVDGFSAKRGS